MQIESQDLSKDEEYRFQVHGCAGHWQMPNTERSSENSTFLLHKRAHYINSAYHRWRFENNEIRLEPTQYQVSSAVVL